MSEREWRFYVSDMIGFCEKVLAFTHGLQLEQLLADAMRFDATVRNIELIGEAASHIPQDARNAHPTIPWRMLIATRNQLIHGYLGLDNDILWSIIQSDVPALFAQLKLLETHHGYP
jgi:uncharacterized protein with HEPN domain